MYRFGHPQDQETDRTGATNVQDRKHAGRPVRLAWGSARLHRCRSDGSLQDVGVEAVLGCDVRKYSANVLLP